jgi:alkylated DNA repair dioxygenase AlkB
MQTSMFEPEAPSIPGVRVIADWLSQPEEQLLADAVDQSPWITDLSRRVQHYGWRYDYKSRRIDREDYLGPLPAWMSIVVSRLVEANLLPGIDQCIVNEYEPGQGIAAHTDCVPCFGPTVAMVSTLSDIQMDFANPRSGATEAVHLPRRSLLILDGEARNLWTHGIAKRRSDPKFSITRSRRLSFTFRSVIQ